MSEGRRRAAAAAAAGAALLSACALVPLTQRPPVDDYPLLPARQETGDPAPPERLTARFFGTSTLAISDGETTIMTDGFFSRPSILELANFPVTPSRRRIEAALAKGGISRVAAIFVAQSHHDHAMDTPYVAALTGAEIVGSSSTALIARGVGFPGERIRAIGNRSVCRFGRFKVTVYRTPHSSPMPFPGEIETKLHRRAWVEDYKEGGNFSFHIEHPWGNVLIVPSRGARLFDKVQAETVFLGIGGRVRGLEALRPLWNAFVRNSRAKTVYPIHWDFFFKAPGRNGLPRLWSVRRKFGYLRQLAREQGGGPPPTVPEPPYAAPILLDPADPERTASGVVGSCPRWTDVAEDAD